MLKILKYMKKSIPAILTIIIFLGIQAFCDLSLPEYTSKIVNNGIQQSGVENPAPQVLRKNQMEYLKLFMDEDDYNKVLDNYELIKKGDSDYVDDYPEVKNQEIYKLKKLSKEESDKLDKLICKPELMLMIFETENDETAKMKEQILASVPAGTIPESTPLIDIISSMPKEQINQITKEISEKFDKYDESILEQMSVSFVKSEYEAIGIDMDDYQTSYILKNGGKMLGIAAIAMICSVLVTYLASKVGALFSKNLRSKVFNKVVSFSNKEFDDFSTASLITRCTNDIQQVQMVTVMSLRMVLYAPIIGVGALLKVINSSMLWVVGVALAAVTVVIGILFISVMPKFNILQKLVDKVNLVSREILTGLPVIRAFSTEKYEEKRFDKANIDLTKVNLFVNRVMAIMMPTMFLIMNAVSVLIVWVGADKINVGTMQVGDLMAVIQYTMQIIIAFLMISMMSIMLPRAAVSGKRIAEVLDKESLIKDKENTKDFDESKKGYVEFKNVCFRYPNAERDVLEDLSFIAKPGETTAIIGSTGSGKSTMINLIPRFFDVTSGEILVDGVNVKDVNQHDLRDRIGYVPQKGLLFTGTIGSNICYGNEDASEEQMVKAAQIAQATEFIDTKPDKYDSPISQGGNNVSGGQKQRLSIARAIAKDPEIFIFDDSFSALDYKTDKVLRGALNAEIKDSTKIIVAQRISTVLDADQILVLNEGRIVGKGTHKELLNSCEVYKQIALSQLSKEELDHE